MTEFLEFNLEQAYEEIKNRATNQGVNSQSAWDELVDDYITEKLEVGELDPDEDTDGMIEDLKHTYSRFEENEEVDVDLNK